MPRRSFFDDNAMGLGLGLPEHAERCFLGESCLLYGGRHVGKFSLQKLDTKLVNSEEKLTSFSTFSAPSLFEFFPVAGVFPVIYKRGYRGLNLMLDCENDQNTQSKT